MNESIFPDGVIDIKFRSDQVYVLKKIDFSSELLEDQLKEMQYTGQNRTVDSATENQKLPPFIYIFFYYIFSEERIPNEDEFFTSYRNKFLVKKNDGVYCEFDGKSFLVHVEGLKARMLRSYPSLIRDFHFYLICKESGYFDKVVYSLKQDYFDGIDVIITKNKITKNVALFTKTKRALHYKNRKYSRHDYDKTKEINLEIDLAQDTKRVSNFYLYSTAILERLKSQFE